jgi:DNA-binding LacI/PurR family transcriptional regulator
MNKLSAYTTTQLAHLSPDSIACPADTLGLLIPHQVTSVFNDPYFSPLVQGIAQGCHHHNYNMLLCLCHSPAVERSIQDQLAGRDDIAGLIYSCAWPDDPLIPQLATLQMPLLILDKRKIGGDQGAEPPTIREMGWQAVETVIERFTSEPLLAEARAARPLLRECAWSTVS